VDSHEFQSGRGCKLRRGGEPGGGGEGRERGPHKKKNPQKEGIEDKKKTVVRGHTIDEGRAVHARKRHCLNGRINEASERWRGKSIRQAIRGSGPTRGNRREQSTQAKGLGA